MSGLDNKLFKVVGIHQFMKMFDKQAINKIAYDYNILDMSTFCSIYRFMNQVPINNIWTVHTANTLRNHAHVIYRDF